MINKLVQLGRNTSVLLMKLNLIRIIFRSILGLESCNLEYDTKINDLIITDVYPAHTFVHQYEVLGKEVGPVCDKEASSNPGNEIRRKNAGEALKEQICHKHLRCRHRY